MYQRNGLRRRIEYSHRIYLSILVRDGTLLESTFARNQRSVRTDPPAEISNFIDEWPTRSRPYGSTERKYRQYSKSSARYLILSNTLVKQQSRSRSKLAWSASSPWLSVYKGDSRIEKEKKEGRGLVPKPLR